MPPSPYWPQTRCWSATANPTYRAFGRAEGIISHEAVNLSQHQRAKELATSKTSMPTTAASSCVARPLPWRRHRRVPHYLGWRRVFEQHCNPTPNGCSMPPWGIFNN